MQGEYWREDFSAVPYNGLHSYCRNFSEAVGRGKHPDQPRPVHGAQVASLQSLILRDGCANHTPISPGCKRKILGVRGRSPLGYGIASTAVRLRSFAPRARKGRGPSGFGSPTNFREGRKPARRAPFAVPPKKLQEQLPEPLHLLPYPRREAEGQALLAPDPFINCKP